MKKAIELSIYNEDTDVNDVVELVKKNRFQLGKLDPNLTVEKYKEYQDRRGFQFAVVAKYAGKVIANIGAYLNGNQGVAAEGEIYLSSAIVDINFRSVMTSIGDLYMAAMEEVIRRGYSVAIADTFKTNMASLYLLRRFGGVLLDSEPNMYDNYVVKIYTPILIKMLQAGSIQKAFDKYGELYKLTDPLNKKGVKEKEELLDGAFIKQTYNMFEKKYDFFINVHNNQMERVYVDDFANIELLDHKQGYKVTAFTNIDLKTVLYGKDAVCEEKVFSLESGEEKEILLSESVEKVFFDFHDETIPIYLFPQKEKVKSSELCEIPKNENTLIDLQTGYMKYFQKGTQLFTEMWPCFSRPFLFGYLVPRKIGLDCQKINENQYLLSEEQAHYKMKREYTFRKSGVDIHTLVEVTEKTIVEPLFHLALDDFNYTCTIITENEVVVKKFDKGDKSYCNEEMIYEYFGDESYTESVLKEIVIETGGRKIQVTTEKPMYCFYQFNYLGFRLVKPSEIMNAHVYAENEMVDLGNVHITILE